MVRPRREFQVRERPVEIIDDANVEAIDLHDRLALRDIDSYAASRLRFDGDASGWREDESIRRLGIAVAAVGIVTEWKAVDEVETDVRCERIDIRLVRRRHRWPW